MMGVGYKGKKAMANDFEVTQSPRTDDWGLNKVVDWKLTRCWFPRECFLTGQNLWGKRAYHGTRMITGPGEPVIDHYYVERDEFILWRLK
jgi:hypothetical protein